MNAPRIVRAVKAMLGSTKPVVLHKEPFKVLIATVLSQRTRDENTAKAASRLFSKYSTPEEIAKASTKEIERLIKPSGFYKVKARRIKKISLDIVKRFNGETPKSMAELLSLEGVGRKTANCVLCFAYKEPAIPVDTHVHRIFNRIGVVNTKTPEETEQVLMKLLPRHSWLDVNDLFVKFGQRICKPVKPRCHECSLRKDCAYFKKHHK